MYKLITFSSSYSRCCLFKRICADLFLCVCMFCSSLKLKNYANSLNYGNRFFIWIETSVGKMVDGNKFLSFSFLAVFSSFFLLDGCGIFFLKRISS